MVYFCWPGTVPKHQAIPAHLEQTDTDSLHLTTQSGPDSQTTRPQARNSSSGCNAAPSYGRRTGFEIGRVGAQFPLRSSRFSDDLKRCIRRTIRDCHGCRSSLAVY